MSHGALISAMKASGIAAETILEVVQRLDADREAARREKTRERVQRHRARKSGEVEASVTDVTPVTLVTPVTVTPLVPPLPPAPPSPPIIPPGGVVDASAFREKCFRAAGLDPQTAMAVPGLVSTIDLERLIRDPVHPCDPDLDVLPAIETCAAGLRKRNQTLSNWSYCRAAILRNRDQRLQGNPAPADAPVSQPNAPASRQKHGGGGVVAASLRLAAKLREGRGVDDDNGGEAEPIDGGGLAEVFSNNRRVAGTS